MGINPDEAVAGSILSGSKPFHNDIILVDICAFTLGIVTTGM